jgi:hypothetical protein
MFVIDLAHLFVIRYLYWNNKRLEVQSSSSLVTENHQRTDVYFPAHLNHICKRKTLLTIIVLGSNIFPGVIYYTKHFPICPSPSLSVTCDRSVFFSFGTPVTSTNKTDRHDITEILLKVALDNITLTIPPLFVVYVTTEAQRRRHF